jgi:broad specificity phosphatase PhoE
MSSLILVRHGQASFFSSNYDRLSETGRLQSRQLAEFWRRNRTSFDAVYTGPLERQRDTASEIFELLADSEPAFPKPRVMEQWNEYDDALVSAGMLERIVERDSGSAQDGDREAVAKRFQKAFETLMQQWVGGEHAVGDGEDWPRFKERVVHGLTLITEAHPRGARVAVFSSGGAISVAIGHVLGIDDQTILELNWTMRNCAVSEILYNREKMSLSGFNNTSHLEPDLLTYR